MKYVDHDGQDRDFAVCHDCPERCEGPQSINWAAFHEVLTGHTITCQAAT